MVVARQDFPQVRLEVGKVVSQSYFIELIRVYFHHNRVAVAVHVLALALVVPQVMGGLEALFHGYFIHIILP